MLGDLAVGGGGPALQGLVLLAEGAGFIAVGVHLSALGALDELHTIYPPLENAEGRRKLFSIIILIFKGAVN